MILSGLSYISVFLCIYILSASVNAEDEKELVLGVLPVISTQKLIARFGPLADYLSEQLSRKVRIETAPNFQIFMDRTNKEKRYDFIVTAPHFYYLAQRRAGYKVIVRVAAPNMKVVIVVPKDSKIKTIHDLKGKTLSTADPLALSTLMVKEHLKQAGLNTDNDVSFVNTPTHTSALFSALKGITDAGSLMDIPYKRAKKDVKQKLSVLAVTKGVVHMPFAVSASLSPTMIKKVTGILTQMKFNKKGKVLLKHMHWPGFVKIKPSDYDNLKWAVEKIK